MNVVYVSTLEVGGPVSHLRDLVPHVAAAGATVKVLCQSERVAAIFRDRGVAAEALPVGSKRDVAGAARLWPALRGADVVHTHDRRAGLFARALGSMRGACVVHTFHGLPDEIAWMAGIGAPLPEKVSALERAWWLHGYLQIESWLTRLGVVVVPSRALADFLVTRGLPAHRIEVVPSGIEVRRREPPAPHDPLAVGTAAVLEPRKAVDVFLSACAAVPAPLRVHVYGDGPLRSSLENLARRLGVDATFHGHVGDLAEPLLDLDVFVLPSRGENLPIAILEAMASALPVVATRVGGVPELVVDGETGLLVDPDDPEALARAIDKLVHDPALRVALGRAASRRVDQHFNARLIGARMVELYRRRCASST